MPLELSSAGANRRRTGGFNPESQRRNAADVFRAVDHGAIVRKATGCDKPRTVRFVIGNPLIMQEMAKRVPDAGFDAPVTVLVDERCDGLAVTACICLVAAWLASCLRAGIPARSRWRRISTGKSKAFCWRRRL